MVDIEFKQIENGHVMAFLKGKNYGPVVTGINLLDAHKKFNKAYRVYLFVRSIVKVQ